MKIVEISAYACGYHSDSEWSESVYIKKETYEKYKEKLDEIEVGVSELDGKHSYVEADIEFTELSDRDVLNASNGQCEDNLYWSIEEVIPSFKEEYKEVWSYIELFDRFVEVTVSVPQSKVKELETFAYSL